jgi:aminopeptidase N
LAHTWFANLVAFRRCDNIWLNETFAEYMGHQTLTGGEADDGSGGQLWQHTSVPASARW